MRAGGIRNVTSYVPAHRPAKDTDSSRLAEFLSGLRRVLVVTGAGVSTESGIPDYRSDGVGIYARDKNFVPVQYSTFVKSRKFRESYWLKNYSGWTNLFNLKPNLGHLTLTEFERKDVISSIVTQNVDNLHQKANSLRVVELHGSAYRIICLGCTYKISRVDFQETLTQLNPGLTPANFKLNPDGIVQLNKEEIPFYVPPCPDCGGILKPDIVFFGENVPRARVEHVQHLVDSCDSLLILGSSLTVMSSYRILLRASEQRKPTAIVNIGKTRGDALVDLKIDCKVGELLPLVFNRLYKS